MNGLLNNHLRRLGALYSWLLDRAFGQYGLASDSLILHLLLNSLVSNVFNHILISRADNIGDLLSLGGGYVFYNSFVGNMGFVLSLMLDLLVVSVRDLNGLVISVLNGLVVSDGLGDFNLVADRGVLSVDVLALIGDLLVGHYRLVISISLLKGDVFEPGLRLRGAQGLRYMLS